MGNESPLLAIGEDIDAQIEEFVDGNPRVTVAEVIRDIARITCILNLVRTGILDGKTTVLCGGMAMRCLESPRLSIWDGDTSSRADPDLGVFHAALSYVDDDIAIRPGPIRGWKRGRQLMTAQPITYEPYFTALDPGQSEFSLSISHRGVERKALWRPLNIGYPFPVLQGNPDVPIMNPDEMLAEKIVAWWLFGHSKHYNDIAFLAVRLASDNRRDLNPLTRRLVRRLVKVKLDRNTDVSEDLARRVDRLNEPERRRRLEEPDEHVDPDSDKGFNKLCYINGKPPPVSAMRSAVALIVLPLLFD